MEILQRIVDGLVSIGEPQSGSVPERGTTDAIIVILQMQEKCLAVNKHIYMAFLALEKALNVPSNIYLVGTEKAMLPRE